MVCQIYKTLQQNLQSAIGNHGFIPRAISPPRTGNNPALDRTKPYAIIEPRNLDAETLAWESGRLVDVDNGERVLQTMARCGPWAVCEALVFKSILHFERRIDAGEERQFGGRLS